jgi:hypothetical protein
MKAPPLAGVSTGLCLGKAAGRKALTRKSGTANSRRHRGLKSARTRKTGHKIKSHPEDQHSGALDAGAAVDVARSIDLDTITVPERKASLLIDTARAFLRWDKPDKAYLALRAAEQTAHEEVAGRPSVHRVVRQLVTAAPPTLRRDAEQFAAHIGAAP